MAGGPLSAERVAGVIISLERTRSAETPDGIVHRVANETGEDRKTISAIRARWDVGDIKPEVLELIYNEMRKSSIKMHVRIGRLLDLAIDNAEKKMDKLTPKDSMITVGILTDKMREWDRMGQIAYPSGSGTAQVTPEMIAAMSEGTAKGVASGLTSAMIEASRQREKAIQSDYADDTVVDHEPVEEQPAGELTTGSDQGEQDVSS